MDVTNIIETSKVWANNNWNIASEKSKKLLNDGWDMAKQNKKTIAIVAGGITAIGIAALLYQQGSALYQQSSVNQLWNNLNHNINLINGHIAEDIPGEIKRIGCTGSQEVAKANINLSGSKSEMISELFNLVKETYNNATSSGMNILKNYDFDLFYNHHVSGYADLTTSHFKSEGIGSLSICSN